MRIPARRYLGDTSKIASEIHKSWSSSPRNRPIMSADLLSAMATQLQVLMVDDSEDDAELVLRSLRTSGRQIVAKRVDDDRSMRDALTSGRWDLVLCDWSMPAFNGAAALSVLKSMELDIPFIIVSGTVTEE